MTLSLSTVLILEWNKRLPFKPIALQQRRQEEQGLRPELIKFLKQSQSQYNGGVLHGIWTT